MEDYSGWKMQERHLTHWQMSVVNLALWRASHQGWNHGNTSFVQVARDERNWDRLSRMKEKTETDQLKWICTSAGWWSTLKTVCMYAEWTHYKHTHIHFDCSYLGTLSKRWSETESGHIWYSAFQLWRFQETRSSGAARGNKNVAWALSRSKSNPHFTR